LAGQENPEKRRRDVISNKGESGKKLLGARKCWGQKAKPFEKKNAVQEGPPQIEGNKVKRKGGTLLLGHGLPAEQAAKEISVTSKIV